MVIHLLFAVSLLPSLARAELLDTDGDGVCDVDEDRNGDLNRDNDDYDGDGIYDYLDPDDDGDGILTIDEDFNGNGDPLDDDLDQDGRPDYIDAHVPLDIDRDGYTSADYGGDDCDDYSPKTFPGAPEQYYDGRDQDCMGGDDFDADGDGYASRVELPGGTDCNDRDASVHPGAEEDLSPIDRNCDGWLDPDNTLLARGGCDCRTGPPGPILGWVLVCALIGLRRRSP
ncbi:MAG TPA: hypothetical protein ENK18_22495 [Deltaproteobacteria bacterium]|nr:hypothetical protein [Deltaproteobacteria bacterium]